MGKTKTAVISELPEEKLSGADKYKLKQQKKKEADALKKAQVGGVGLKGGERIKVIGGGPVVEETEIEKGEVSKRRALKVRGNKYKSAKKKIDRNKTYPLSKAIKLVKDASFTSFDGTVELHLIVKKAGVNVNVKLPHASGKIKRVEIANAKTIETLKKGKINFDVLLATTDMMPKIVPFAKLLGPKGLMPNPKNGTLIKDKKDAKKFSGNSLNVKTEKKQPIIHTIIGKVSQKDKEIEANAEAILEALNKKTIVKAYICSTMSPSAKLKI